LHIDTFNSQEVALTTNLYVSDQAAEGKFRYINGLPIAGYIGTDKLGFLGALIDLKHLNLYLLAPWKQHIKPLKGVWQPKQVFFEGLPLNREQLADYSVVFDEDRLELKSPQFGHHKYRSHYKSEYGQHMICFYEEKQLKVKNPAYAAGANFQQDQDRLKLHLSFDLDFGIPRELHPLPNRKMLYLELERLPTEPKK
jgi:hypothetical protein